MYKCNHCGAIFYETSTREEESCHVPSPFGMGIVTMGGGHFDCCPQCQDYNYEDMYFDGAHCPYCGELIKLKDIKEDDGYEFKCDKCKTEFIIEKGEIEDAYKD